jgi:hypothetical protein
LREVKIKIQIILITVLISVFLLFVGCNSAKGSPINDGAIDVKVTEEAILLEPLVEQMGLENIEGPVYNQAWSREGDMFSSGCGFYENSRPGITII